MANTEDKHKITFDTNAKDAAKDTNKLGNEVENVSEQQKKVEKTTKKSNKALEGTGKVTRAVGSAFKKIGLGVVIGLFGALATALTKNQKVLNGVQTVLGTISIVFSQITDVLVSVYENVSKSSENFDALGKVLGGITTLALAPLKLGFYGIKLAITEAQLIWEQSFFGDGDPEKIKELNASIYLTKEALEDVAVGALDASKDIINNFGEAISEAGNIAGQVVEGVSKISIKAAFETAKTNQALENSARLAAAEQQRLVEQYDRAAELQRQIRDDESKSIEERQAANEKLGEILNDQEKAMLKQADLQVAYAQSQIAINDNIDNRIALTEALANQEGVLAQVEGFRSEQLVNRVALEKEQSEAIQAEIDARAEADKKAKEDQIAREKALEDAKQNVRSEGVSNVENIGKSLQTLAGKNKEVAKAGLIVEGAVGAANIVSNTMQANAKAAAAFPLTGGMPFTAINTASGGLALAAQIKAVSTGLKALGGGGGGGSSASIGGGGRPSTPPAVAFNNTAENQIGQSVARTQSEQGPMTVNVLESDITTAQSNVKILESDNSF